LHQTCHLADLASEKQEQNKPSVPGELRKPGLI